MEFQEIYEKLPTIEYIFKHGFTPIDAVIMDRVVQTINERHPDFELKLDGFHSRGQPHAIFTVLHKEHTDKAFTQIKRGYEERIKILEGKRTQLLEVISLLTNKPQNLQLIAKEIIMSGDSYKIQGQTGAVGPSAYSHDINFNEIWNQLSSEIDITRLSKELAQLRLAMKKESETLERIGFLETF